MIALFLVLAAMQPAEARPAPPPFLPCSRRPVPRAPCLNLAGLMRRAYYPREAWARGQQGDVSFRAEVDPYGNVTRCWITRSSGVPSLDSHTCAMLRRQVVFNAARDAGGRAVGGIVEDTIRYRHPRLRGAR
jgi:TonB family protein